MKIRSRLPSVGTDWLDFALALLLVVPQNEDELHEWASEVTTALNQGLQEPQTTTTIMTMELLERALQLALIPTGFVLVMFP